MRLVVLGVALLLVAVACTDSVGEGAPSPTTAPGTPGSQGSPDDASAPDTPDSLYDLEQGDCFSGLGQRQDLRIRIVPCRRQHQAEVYGAFDVGNRRFPGADVLRRQAATQCAQHFVGYTGEPPGPNTDVAFTEVVPTLDSFTTGDRRALCVALGIDGAPLQGSIARAATGAA